MPRPLLARIDRAALLQNYLLARAQAAGAATYAVLKADAYGHGLLPMALALRNHADGFALIEIEAAVELRRQGFTQPIMLLEGFYHSDDITLFAEYRLSPVLHSPWQVEALCDACLPSGLPVFLKVETGMNRLGLRAGELHAAIARLQARGCASSITLMTHFADADGERGIAAQMAEFARLAAGMRLPFSVANSAALLRFPGQVGGPDALVRPGIMLYGASPCPQIHSAQALGLHPVMSLHSELIAVREVAAGARVGYSGTFTAPADMTIGVVACGYGDGYPRQAPTGTPVMVDGQRSRTLGRVSMDKLCVDLSGLKPAAIGTPVLLWGELGGQMLPADEVAGACGTIAYELFCALAGRVDISYVH